MQKSPRSLRVPKSPRAPKGFPVKRVLLCCVAIGGLIQQCLKGDEGEVLNKTPNKAPISDTYIPTTIFDDDTNEYDDNTDEYDDDTVNKEKQPSKDICARFFDAANGDSDESIGEFGVKILEKLDTDCNLTYEEKIKILKREAEYSEDPKVYEMISASNYNECKKDYDKDIEDNCVGSDEFKKCLDTYKQCSADLIMNSWDDYANFPEEINTEGIQSFIEKYGWYPNEIFDDYCFTADQAQRFKCAEEEGKCYKPCYNDGNTEEEEKEKCYKDCTKARNTCEGINEECAKNIGKIHKPVRATCGSPEKCNELPHMDSSEKWDCELGIDRNFSISKCIREKYKDADLEHYMSPTALKVLTDEAEDIRNDIMNGDNSEENLERYKRVLNRMVPTIGNSDEFLSYYLGELEEIFKNTVYLKNHDIFDFIKYQAKDSNVKQRRNPFAE